MADRDQKWLKNKIGSLPAEQQSEDLNDEIRIYIANNFDVCFDETLECEGMKFTTGDFVNAARHFAEWQKDIQLNKACEWLRKHVLEYFDDAGVGISTFTENFIAAMEDEQ